MMKNLYTFVSGFFYMAVIFGASFSAKAQVQNCTGLSISYTTSESRCMSTGSIKVRVSGGSGNFNYQAAGPVTTPFTSSTSITGLPPGTYTLIVKDVSRNCLSTVQDVVVKGSYQDPRFVLTKTDVSCARNDGAITVSGQQFGRSPFSYSIVAPSPAAVGTTNSTGLFKNLIPGEYAIQLRDSCGGIQVRRITIEDYSWWFDGVTVSKTDCNNAKATIRLKDNKGNINTTNSAAFSGFKYGVIQKVGDTLWYTTATFNVYTGNKSTIQFVASDACRGKLAYTWNVPAHTMPSVGNVTISNTNCTTFTATVANQLNLTNPQFAIYNSQNALLLQNTTGVFTDLAYGSYCIQIKDGCYDTTISRCFTAAKPVASVNNSVSISGRTCSTVTATITGQTALTNPQYCLYDASNKLIACNTTGVFKNVSYAQHCIRITDACGASLERCFTPTRPIPVLNSVNISAQGCSTFTATASGSNLISPTYCLYDINDSIIACNTTGVFTNLPNGSYCISATSCGITTAQSCFTGKASAPSAAVPVTITNRACNTFSAAVTGQVNLTNPTYCLLNNNNVQIACNSTGIFDNISYGSYCIRIKDGCVDTSFTRCFTEARPAPAVAAAMEQSDATCTNFTARVTGQQNLYDAQYCLYDAANNLVACNTTGVFNKLPYGRYCMVATDGCTGTALRVCQDFQYKYSFSLTTSKSCVINSANINMQFNGGMPPYNITVYDPVSIVVHQSSVTGNSSMLLPELENKGQYTIVAVDACGKKDTARIDPDASYVSKNITATPKCPSAAWLNGSGDLRVECSSNLGSMKPVIIKRNSEIFTRNYSSNTANRFTFSDLEPAVYVVEYSIQNCSNKIYDTFELKPYAYPTQGRSAIYQCDNQSLNLVADVLGGIGPYQYQIIGSEPHDATINTGLQASPEFFLNTGISYSLIRLRSIDACGNATLNDVSVLPLQNIEITATSTCFYSPITLAVDTIPYAHYSWYKKTGLYDSVLVSNSMTYHIPFMMQEDVGTYMCKIELNNNCLTRLASFYLSGDCGNTTLPVKFKLEGKVQQQANVLSWTIAEPQQLYYYDIERRKTGEDDYRSINRIYTQSAGTQAQYQFNDTSLCSASYRLKLTMKNGVQDYSNSVSLRRSQLQLEVYPNPVGTHAWIDINTQVAAAYRIELRNATGQLVFTKELPKATRQHYRMARSRQWPGGMYLLKITNLYNGHADIQKLMLQ